MENFAQYLRDTVSELRQVKWPTQNQAMVYTGLVIAVCTVVALFVGLWDFIFALGIDTIINRF
jgi:preprotein translocase SecE subunit